MTHLCKYGENIFDVAIIAYQDASRVYELMTINPQIENINSDLTGIEVSFIQEFITTKEVIKTASIQEKNVTITFNQSSFDIALQYYGGIDKVYDFIVENGVDNISSDITGLNLNYTVDNTYVPLFFRTKSKNIATKYPIENADDIMYRITGPGDYRITEVGNNRII